jgi:hypothetical protein
MGLPVLSVFSGSLLSRSRYACIFFWIQILGGALPEYPFAVEFVFAAVLQIHSAHERLLLYQSCALCD